MAQTTSASHLPEKPNKYKVNLPLAIWAGILGQILFLPFYYIVYFTYQEDSLDLIRVFGSFVSSDPLIRFGAGLVAVMGIGVVTAVAYAWVLYILNLQSSGGFGFVFGFFVFQPIFAFVLPWTVAFLATFTGIQMNNPDVLMNQAGHGNAWWDGPMIVLVAYLLYGVTVGAVYRHQTLDTTRYRVAYQGG